MTQGRKGPRWQKARVIASAGEVMDNAVLVGRELWVSERVDVEFEGDIERVHFETNIFVEAEGMLLIRADELELLPEFREHVPRWTWLQWTHARVPLTLDEP